MANDCGKWTAHHSASGRRLGITEKEINNLFKLDKSDFDFKEWLALKYAQEWTFLDGQEPSGDYVADFKNKFKKIAMIVNINAAIGILRRMDQYIDRKQEYHYCEKRISCPVSPFIGTKKESQENTLNWP